MVDFNRSCQSALDLNFTSDTSKNKEFGIGAVFGTKWIFGQWETGYIEKYDLSIEYLELFGLVAAILTWGNSHQLCNTKVILYCDNSAVMEMVNNLTSKCKNCMYLLRLLALNNLVNNRTIYVRYISSKNNFLSDALSRLQFKHFWSLALANINKSPDKITPLLWPPSKIWQVFNS